jgi:hypothetical protein
MPQFSKMTLVRQRGIYYDYIPMTRTRQSSLAYSLVLSATIDVVTPFRYCCEE